MPTTPRPIRVYAPFVDEPAESQSNFWFDVRDYGAVEDDATDSTTAVIAAAVAAGSRGAVFIPPKVKFNINTVMDDATVPLGVQIYDYSARTSDGNEKIIGIHERGSDVLGTYDLSWELSSGHHPTLRLSNTGKSPSPSAAKRLASIIYTGGRYHKGPAVNDPRNIGMLQFRQSLANPTRWEFAMRHLAPWAAVDANYWQWGAGVTTAIGEYCISNGRFYVSTSNGSTGDTAPAHLAGSQNDHSDGVSGIDWTFVDGGDTTVFTLDDLGRLSAKALVHPESTATDGDTTPSVSGIGTLIVSNTAPTSITTFDDGIQGQSLELFFTNAKTTLVNSASLKLQDGIDVTPTTSSIIGLRKFTATSAWVERYRSLK